MRILRRQRKYWQVAGADLKATEAGAWFEIACAKNRAVIPNVSLIFHELPKEHMAVMHPHTANIHTHRNITHYSSSVHFFFYSFMPFHKAFWTSKNATITVVALHFRRNARSKQSNPLLHILRINIIFIHKLSGKTAVVPVKGHLSYTHSQTDMCKQPLSVMRAGSNTRVLVFFS